MQDTLAKKVFAVGSAIAMAAALVPSLALADTAHGAGQNVSTSDGTVWFITQSGTRRAYTSAGAFTSYGFNSWSNVVPANAADLALPVDSAGFIPPQDGKIFCATETKGSDVKGECALISGGMKHSFTSAAVFTGLGFSFTRAVSGDSSFMSKSANVDNSTSAHLPGVLVNNNGTVQLVGSNGLLGIPDLATFNGWGYSFNDVVKANSADMMMTQTGVMAARVAGQLSPVAAVPCTSNCGPVIPPNGGALSVSLSSMTPAASSFATGAAFLPFTSVNFTAGSNPVVVTSVKATRNGLGADTNLDNMYLFDGNTMIAQSASFQNAVVTFTNSAGLFTVPANSTKTITIKGDLSSGGGSGLTYGFSVNSASDIVSNASGVSGSFPVVGNLMTSATVSSPSLATLTVTAVAVGTSVNAGTTDVLAGQWSLTSANSTVQVKGISMTMIGSAASTGFQNLKLMANGAQVGSTIVSMPTNKVIFFDLSGSPMNVTTGQTVSLQLKADIVSEVNRTYQFSIQHKYDIMGYDMTYNVGILSGSTFPINSPTTEANINAGSLTITRSSDSRTTSVVASQTGIKLATFDFTAYGEDVKILSLPITITSNAGGASITNIKLVDDQGYGIGTQVTSTQNVTSGGYANTFGASSNLNYVIPANTTRKVSIVADLTSANAAATTITASLATPVSANAQGVTSVNSITTTAAGGNALTVASSALTSVINTGLASPVKIVPGVSGAKLASFSLTSGGADAINVSTITITAASASVTGNFQNMRLKQGSTQIGNAQPTITNSGQYTFSPSSPIVIPAGGSVVIDVYADLISSASTTLFVGQSLFTLSGATAQLSSSGASVSMSPVSVTGQTVTTAGTGTITVAKDSNGSPVARQIAMGQSGVVLGVIKFSETSNNEAVTLTDLTITATSVAGTPLNGSASTSISSLTNFTLDDGLGHTYTKQNWTTTNANGVADTSATSTNPTTNKVTFNNVNFTIPANGTLYLTVKADINSWANGGASGSTYVVGINAAADVTLRGQSSQTAVSNPTITSNASSNTQTVVRSTVTVTAVGSISSPSVTVNPTGVVASDEVMGIFKVAASDSGDVQLNTITLQQGGTAPTAVAVTYSIYDTAVSVTSNPVCTVALTAGTANATGACAVQITKGNTKTLVVKANTSNFNTQSGSGSYKTYTLKATDWSFNDGQTTPYVTFSQSADAGSVTAVTSTGAGRTY